jgi:hypothetical protein
MKIALGPPLRNTDLIATIVSARELPVAMCRTLTQPLPMGEGRSIKDDESIAAANENASRWHSLAFVMSNISLTIPCRSVKTIHN